VKLFGPGFCGGSEGGKRYGVENQADLVPFWPWENDRKYLFVAGVGAKTLNPERKYSQNL
jgi:hypothetical protein